MSKKKAKSVKRKPPVLSKAKLKAANDALIVLEKANKAAADAVEAKRVAAAKQVEADRLAEIAAKKSHHVGFWRSLFMGQ